MNTADNHRIIAHALALSAKAADTIRPYCSKSAAKIELACEKILSNEPRAMTSFRRVAEQLQDFGDEHIEESDADSASDDYDKWLDIISDIDKDLDRIDDPSAAKTFDRTANHGIDCSKCGELLRAPFAQQCASCGHNWH